MADVIRAIALCALLTSGCLFWEPTASVESTCLNLCGCLTNNTVAEDQCEVECNDQLTQNPVPQECLDCVTRASCEELEDLNTTCAVECGGAASRIVEVTE